MVYREDGSIACMAARTAYGRAEITAYQLGSSAVSIEDPNSVETTDEKEICARFKTGAGSDSWYAFLGAAFGAAIAALPAMLLATLAGKSYA